MVVKILVSGDKDKTLDEVFEEMSQYYKSMRHYVSLYNNFIKDILGYKNMRDLTSNDIDYFYIYLANKTYSGHFYSKAYIRKIMNLLKNIFDYGIKRRYTDTNLAEIKLYFLKNID